jgi:hypothetical protein
LRRTTCRAISRFQAAGPGFAHLPPERGFSSSFCW